MHSTRPKWFYFALLFAAISGFFVARFPVRPELAAVSAGFVLVFAAPGFYSVGRWLGAKKAILALCALGAYALVLETVAVKTGVPYGRFSYGPKIGALLFNAVPWTVPFSWTPLLLWAFWLGRGRIFLVGGILLLGDLCLDPGAVAQAFWRYDAGGAYYGVPLSNFAGWVLSGTLGAYLGRKLLVGNLEPPFGVATSGLLSLGFWCSVCGFMGLWVPTLVGLGLLGGSIFWSFRKKNTSSS
jgi:bisanhydrobacterioruberin hydratase